MHPFYITGSNSHFSDGQCWPEDWESKQENREAAEINQNLTKVDQCTNVGNGKSIIGLIWAMYSVCFIPGITIKRWPPFHRESRPILSYPPPCPAHTPPSSALPPLGRAPCPHTSPLEGTGARLVAHPPRCNSITRKNLPLCYLPLYIAVTFGPTLRFKNPFRFRLVKNIPTNQIIISECFK